MMKDGKLVWSREDLNGGWYAYEHANGERSFFVASPQYPGWTVELVTRYRDHVEREDLGEFRYLKDAKRAADIRHHRRILDDEEASEGLKDYVRRHPITEESG